MKRIIASVILLAVTIGLSVTLSSCGAKKQTSSSEYTDYRDIPGVTAAEIAAIEKLKEQYDSFSVKNILSDNMFLKNDLVEFPDSEAASDSTEYAGFSMAFCAYLSQLFGIEFVVGSVDWDSLLSGVSSGEIDFSADLTATEARKQRGYIFSEPIASRHITAFRVKEVNPVPYNQFEGKKRVMFLRGNVNEFNVFNGDLSLYTPVYIDSTAEIVPGLLENKADYYVEDMATALYLPPIEGATVVQDQLYPVSYEYASLSTGKYELKPIITVVDKLLASPSFDTKLNELHRKGEAEYAKLNFRESLSDIERAYLDARIENNQLIKIIYQTNNYPISFYDIPTSSNKGISADIVDHLTDILGIGFEAVSAENNPATRIAMLNGGQADILTNIASTPERNSVVIMSKVPVMSVRTMLITKQNAEEISLENVVNSHLKIGIQADTVWGNELKKLIPTANNLQTYSNLETLFTGLDKGEIDAVFAPSWTLLAAINYLKITNVEPNYTFETEYDLGFAYPKKAQILASIVDKALYYVNIKDISLRWSQSIHDYRGEAVSQQKIYMALFIFFSTVIVTGVLIVAIKFRSKNIQLTLLNRKESQNADDTRDSLLALMANNPDLVFLFDADLRVLDCNDKFYDVFHFKDKLDVLTNFYKVIGAAIADEQEDRKSIPITERLKTALKDGEERSESILILDGEKHVFDIMYKRITYMGNPAIACYAKDISNTKETLSALVEQNQLLANHEMLLTTMNHLGIMLFSNPDNDDWEEPMVSALSYAQMATQSDRVSLWRNYEDDGKVCAKLISAVGYHSDTDYTNTFLYEKYLPDWLNSEEVLYKYVSSNLDEPDFPYPYFRDWVVNSIGAQSITMVPIVMDGKLWGLFAVSYDSKGHIFSQSEINIFWQAGLECAAAVLVSERTKSLSEASMAKSLFLSRMSHEIRTPLNAIVGMTQIGSTSNDINRKNYAFTKIKEASAHLLGVINDILDISKIEANKLELANEEFNVEFAFKKAADIISFKTAEKQQQFSIKLDGNIPPYLVGDDQRFSQVILNLLSNAMKFTPDGGKISLSSVLYRLEDGYAEIITSVSDSGIGISLENQKKLFSNFMQADGGISRKFGGTGLGLAISKKIAELMDGDITVKSEEGKGSTFSFAVRLKVGDTEPEAVYTVDKEKLRILTVDDDSNVLEYFKDFAEGSGLNIDTASTANEAIEKIELNGGYDIYFIDWRMPDVDGIELSRRIKNDINTPNPNGIIIMISGADYSLIEVDATSAGIKHFLPKPLFASDIVNVINECAGEIGEKLEPHSADFAGKTILVAEDVDINQVVLSALLEDTNIIIDFADNGQIAVDMYTANPTKYDLIFMDVHMPEMDGYEATKQIRAAERALTGKHHIPIIAMTANVFREDVERCLAAGMDAHIGKPIDFTDVINKIKEYTK